MNWSQSAAKIRVYVELAPRHSTRRQRRQTTSADDEAGKRIRGLSRRRTALSESDQSNDRLKKMMHSSSVTTDPDPLAPKENQQMSSNTSTMPASSPAALRPETLRTSLTLVVIAALAAFALRAVGLTFGF
jgi:hypothetical protein